MWLNFIKHCNMKSHFVLKFDPKFSITGSRAFCFHVNDLILVRNFILYIFLPFLDSKHKVVFGYQTCSKPSRTNLVFIDSNHAVVTGKTILLVRAYDACFSCLNFIAWLFNYEIFTFDKLSKVRQINY